jgi:hypothetical protein
LDAQGTFRILFICPSCCPRIDSDFRADAAGDRFVPRQLLAGLAIRDFDHYLRCVAKCGVVEGSLKLFVGIGGAVAAAFLLASACGIAQAGSVLDNWRFDTGSDGQVTASLHATNKLITGGGALSYSPILTIACRAKGEPRWSEWLQLNDAVSASRTITVSVTVNKASKVNESWSVGAGQDAGSGWCRRYQAIGFRRPASSCPGGSGCCRGEARPIST